MNSVQLCDTSFSLKGLSHDTSRQDNYVSFLFGSYLPLSLKAFTSPIVKPGCAYLTIRTLARRLRPTRTQNSTSWSNSSLPYFLSSRTCFRPRYHDSCLVNFVTTGLLFKKEDRRDHCRCLSIWWTVSLDLGAVEAPLLCANIAGLTVDGFHFYSM